MFYLSRIGYHRSDVSFVSLWLYWMCWTCEQFRILFIQPECSTVATELAREVALLPPALQSGAPDLLVDYLAGVFKPEDGQVVHK
jgi:hypothetical protein